MTTYTYDGVGQLTKESESNGTTLAYTYDRNGNRTKLTATGSEYYTVVYTYDAANRLTKETRTEGSTVTWTDYTYDSNGNVLTKTNKSGMGVVRSEGNEYNGYNQLVTQTVNEEGVITDLAYEYYPNGIRSVKAVDGVPTVYVANNGYVVAEYYETTLTAVYLWGANLIKSGIGSKTNYYLYNAHGDVVQLTSTTGAVVRNYTYDAFGVEDDPDDFDTNPFRYCGEYYDRESKTYYLRARYYDPAIGRFTQQDTHWNTANMIYGDDPQKINEREDKLELTAYTMVPQITAVAQSGNLYSYCIGNPLCYRDSSGCQAVVYKPDAVPIGAIYTGFPLEDIWKDLLEFGGIICAYFLLGNEKTGVIDFVDEEGKEAVPNLDGKTAQDGTSQDGKKIKYPGDDPSVSPGEDWEWRGPKDKGSWYNPKTGESLHPDLDHPAPVGPHWDYKDPSGKQFRVFPDGRMEPK